MTVVQFASCLPAPHLTRRVGNTPLLVTGLALVLAGLVWMAQLTAATPYLTGVAIPMMLIGLGQGLAFGPLTAAGIAGGTALLGVALLAAVALIIPAHLAARRRSKGSASADVRS
jgi:hypothetical protein